MLVILSGSTESNIEIIHLVKWQFLLSGATQRLGGGGEELLPKLQ